MRNNIDPSSNFGMRCNEIVLYSRLAKMVKENLSVTLLKRYDVEPTHKFDYTQVRRVILEELKTIRHLPRVIQKMICKDLCDNVKKRVKELNFSRYDNMNINKYKYEPTTFGLVLQRCTNAQVTTLPTIIVESGSKKLEFIQNLNEFERLISAILENFWLVR